MLTPVLGEARGGPLGGHEADRLAGSAGGDRHAGGDRDGPLYGRVGVHRPAKVQKDGQLVVPGHLVLPDHQLAAVGGRRPVDPPEVVADRVRPKRVLLVVAAEKTGARVVGPQVVAPSPRREHQGLDAGEDDEPAGRSRRHPSLGQTEGVLEHDLERPHLEEPPTLGRQRVADRDPPGGPDRT
jgi:hypothetical protein